MAQSIFPAASGGGIRLVQRGQAVSSGNIVITSVDTTKTFVRSFSEGASGTVATNSTVASTTSSGTLSPSGGSVAGSGLYDTSLDYTNYQRVNNTGSFSTYAGSRTITSASISGGTMDGTTKQMGVYLSNSTTLVATGACRWEVVEFA